MKCQQVSITNTAIIRERDFKSEYLFRMISIVTNLVTSLEFQPFLCTTMLCHFERTQNGSVATRFFLLSSAAASSATSGYVVVPERFGQNEARASRNVERTRKKPSFVTSSGFNRCSLKPHVNLKLSPSFKSNLLCVFYLVFAVFLLISSCGTII